MSSNQIVFLVLAAVAVVAALGVIAFPKNAVRSALSLVVNFFVLAFIYFTLNAQLLGITQILVYTGAIMVLFLFVIMLLNLGAGQDVKESNDPKLLVGGALGFGLAALLGTQLLLPMREFYATPLADEKFGMPQAIGYSLFTTYVWPFLITSVLLLVGIVGAILLAKRRII